MRLVAALSLVPCLALAAPGNAAVTLTQSGYVLDATDHPFEGANVAFGFRVFDTVAGGTAQWSDDACAVTVVGGFYSVLLGAGDCTGDGLDTADLPSGAPRWLEVSVDGSVMDPRLLLSAVPVATLAADAQRLGGALPNAYVTKAELATPTVGVNTTGLVHWSQLADVPAGLADGTDAVNTYGADEATITLGGSQFSVKTGGIASTQLASEAASLGKVSGGALTTTGGDLVVGSGKVLRAASVGGSVVPGIRIGGGSNDRLTLTGAGLGFSSTGAPILFGDGTADHTTITPGGFVGLGSLTPGERLDVVGNIRATGSITGATISGTHTGNGAGLTNVNAASVGGQTLTQLQAAFAPAGGNATTATCDAAHKGYVYFDSTANQFRGCDGSGNWLALSGSTGSVGSATNPGRSCLDVLNRAPGAPSGPYYVSPQGGAAFQTWCDMTTSGGGWTLVAVVAQGDAGGNQWTHASGTWESATTFGSPGSTAASTTDFKSPAYGSLKGKALMISYKNQFLLRTDEGCLQEQTVQARFAQLAWEGAGSEAWGAGTPHAHPCLIAQSATAAGERALLNGGTPNRLLLKWGEFNGAQDSNKDRAYFSTSIRSNLDVPRGLGAFNSGACSSPNCENDVGGFNPDGSDNDIATPGTNGDFYGIYVREAFGTTCRTIKESAPASATGLYTIDPDGPGGAAAYAAWCDMATAGGGWTLVLRDNWDTVEVAKGQTVLPAANSVGAPDGTGDYVGPWGLQGTFLYRCKSCAGDNAFLSHQTLPLGLAESVMPSGYYDTPMQTLAGATVMADQDPSHRLNYFSNYGGGNASCGPVSAGRDNPANTNCWANFFATSTNELLPGGNARSINAAGHVAELYVR